MKSIIILAFILITPSFCLCATLYVPGGYSSIQDAIDAAVNGDTILVSMGTYVENISFKGKAIIVEGEHGPDATVIDGGHAGSVVSFTNGEGMNSVLKGFTVTNGSGTYYSSTWGNVGGGIIGIDTSPTIENNNVNENWAHCGGGIGFIGSSMPTIVCNRVINNSVSLGLGGGIAFLPGCSGNVKGNLISGNTTDTERGGGISTYQCSMTISDNLITGNSSGWSGGGISSHSSSDSIDGNTITGNAAANNGGGGGIYTKHGSTTITNNIISNNSAALSGGGIRYRFTTGSIENNIISGNHAVIDGGGIRCWSASPLMAGNLFSDNIAGSNGGGIHIETLGCPTLSDNMITENTAGNCGGGIYCFDNSSVTIVNCTISQNSSGDSGGGLACYHNSDAMLTNAILWENGALTGPEIWIAESVNPSSVSISYSDVKGGKTSVYVDPSCTLTWGPGLIDADPLFVDSANGDFHLTYPSPCKETGDNSVVTGPTDFEGDPRIAYGTADMGADEFYTHLYWTGDATPGGKVEVKFVGLPGTAPVALCIGTGVLNTPIKSMWGDWYLQFPIVGPIVLPSVIPATGILVLPGDVPGTPPGPYSIPMQALIGGELSNLCMIDVE